MQQREQSLEITNPYTAEVDIKSGKELRRERRQAERKSAKKNFKNRLKN